MDEKIQNFVTDLIKTQNVMVLATAENNISHACTVWYTSSNGRHLYFLSRTATRHCQIIANYPQVSVVVFDPASTYAIKKGVQMLGKVEKVCDETELNVVAAGYIAAFPASKKMISSLLPAMAGPGAPAAFYRVTIEQVKALNTEADIIQPDYVLV